MRLRRSGIDDAPFERARQARAFRIGAIEGGRCQHDQARAGGQPCIQLAQQAADGWRAGG